LSSPDFGEINNFCWYITNFIFLIWEGTKLGVLLCRSWK
jgi:hypothetical protein